MHFVSCRQSTSGLTALRNLATRSMRRRTELMFHVVRKKRLGRTYQDRRRKTRLILSGHSTASRRTGLFVRPSFATRASSARSDKGERLARRGRIVGEIDLEQAWIDLLGGIQIIVRDGGVIA